MPSPRHDLRPSPPPDKYGLPGVSYPTNDKSEYSRVVEDVPIAQRRYTPLTRYTEHPDTGGSTGIALAVLTEEIVGKGDGNRRQVRRIYETLPGPPLTTYRIDPEDGSVIIETKRAVRAIPANTATATGSSTTTYESRDQNPLVDWQTTRTTALDGVVRSLPARVNLRLPRVLAGVAVTFNIQKGEGDDASNGTGGSSMSSFSVNASASARASSSLNVTPEVYLPIRDRQDEGESVPAFVKQIFLTGAITEAAILARLTAVYEVVVSGTLTPAAGGTYLGNASNVNGVIWFSKESTARKLTWTNGVWKLGTDAEVLAGNYWSLTAAATAWLGSYAPQGTASGTATVAVGRTVSMMPNWGTQEVSLVAAGEQASVSSNASASGSWTKSDAGESKSTSLGAGFSVSSGGNQSRVRVEPTLHGQIIIAKSSYSDTVNATAAAVIGGAIAVALGTTGIDSGFSPTHAQTVQSYVRINASPITATPSPATISGNTVANPTIVTTSTPHNLANGASVVITLSNSAPLLDGTHVITWISATTFSVPVNVTVAGTAGSVQGPAVNSSTTIPATDPADVPTSGLYALPQYQVSGKDAQYVGVNATVVDMGFLGTAPIGLGYSDPAPSYRQGESIAPNQPYFLGGGAPTSYAISPSLGAGLSFNTTTGVITGNAAGGQVATTYVVTATNGAGSTNTTISITVTI